MERNKMHSRWNRRASLIALFVGAGATALALLVSYLDLMGAMPPELYGEPATRLAAFRMTWLWPPEFLGLMIFIGIAVVMYAQRRVDSETSRSLPSYMFLLSIIGLALELRLMARTNFVTITPFFAAASFVALLTLSALADEESFRTLGHRLLRDAKLALGSPRAIGIGATILIFFLGTTQFIYLKTAYDVTTRAHVPQFERWFAAQVRPAVGARVVGTVEIVEYHDYQCPPCRSAFLDHRKAVEKLSTLHPGKITFVAKDFPLEKECNSGSTSSTHPLACEAAVAVRVARKLGKGDELEKWLFASQDGLTLEAFRKHLDGEMLTSTFDSSYADEIIAVKKDVAEANALGVSATPTFFVNGVKLQSITALDLETAVKYELNQGPSKVASGRQ
jgi:uncharacterized membrane protein